MFPKGRRTCESSLLIQKNICSHSKEIQIADLHNASIPAHELHGKRRHTKLTELTTRLFDTTTLTPADQVRPVAGGVAGGTRAPPEIFRLELISATKVEFCY